MKPYNERPWWCQLLPSVFGPPWYAEIEDFDAWLAEVRERIARRAEEDDAPTADGEGRSALAVMPLASARFCVRGEPTGR